MRKLRGLFPALVVVTVAALVGAACGKSNPASPSGANRIVLRGVVVGAPTASGRPGELAALGSSGGKIKVTVREDISITTTVSANGTFELDGVPEGKFNLVFTNTSATTPTQMGTVTVPPGAGREIRIVVEVRVTVIVVIKIEIDGHEVPAPTPHDGDDDD